MSSIFELDTIQDNSPQIDMNELYEKKQKHNQQQLEIYNKVLGRIHKRIRFLSKQTKPQTYCWFVIPETILGVPKYDHPDCIAYVHSQLIKNGFAVRYIHPNLLYICWHHWIPSYIRNEIKKKTGVEIDEFGKRKEEEPDEADDDYNATKDLMNSRKGSDRSNSSSKTNSTNDTKYKSIDKYKPKGNLIYSEELFYK